MSEQPTGRPPHHAERPGGEPEADAADTAAAPPQSVAPGGALDAVTGFMGLRWEDPETVRLTIRPELINRGGMLSGVVTYAMVDYCMGSALWAQTSEDERIATISISINYVQTATEGEIICRTTVDRRNRRNAVMHSEVRHEDGRLMVTAIGSYSIFPRAGTGARGIGRRSPATAPTRSLRAPPRPAERPRPFVIIRWL